METRHFWGGLLMLSVLGPISIPFWKHEGTLPHQAQAALFRFGSGIVCLWARLFLGLGIATCRLRGRRIGFLLFPNMAGHTGFGFVQAHLRRFEFDFNKGRACSIDCRRHLLICDRELKEDDGYRR